jgi:hypothetical protein
VVLNANPGLSAGGWVETPVEWPVLEGVTYWLIGYWQEKAGFVRLTSNQRNPQTTILVGYRDSNQDVWQPPAVAVGLMVEVTYLIPDQGVPSGILDPFSPSAGGLRQTIRASIAGDGLSISLYPSSTSYQPYELLVVNILGQTVVSGAGMTDFGEVSVPWSATHPSGVYFCRIRLGGASHTVSVVNLK